METTKKEKGLADQLYEAQQRKKRAFTTNVAISWVVLLLILVYLFSGTSLSFGGIQLKTIRLDKAFIQENLTFVASGAGVTIGISLLSIALAMILALLAALGRLSKFPPVYALSTFYVSLIRGTPLYLQIFFFFLALSVGRCTRTGFKLWRLHERNLPCRIKFRRSGTTGSLYGNRHDPGTDDAAYCHSTSPTLRYPAHWQRIHCHA